MFKLSIVVPVLNEQANIEPLYHAVTEVMGALADQYTFELLFTDNHSSDQTLDKIKALAANDQRVRAIRFSRNVGFQRSILVGYLSATGDAVLQLDCDLQDPPELIPDFLRYWEQGYRVVYGVRVKRGSEAWWLTMARKTFYRLVNLLSEDPIPLDAGDFRLVDRRVIEELRQIDDLQPYLRGMIATLGFRQLAVEYERRDRNQGESKFSFSDLLSLALDGILSQSVLPLRFSSYGGLCLSAAAFLLGIWYLLSRFFFGHQWPAGWATLVFLNLFSLGMNAFMFGIVGEYLGRIYKQVKHRPLAIIEEEVNPPQRGEFSTNISRHPTYGTAQRDAERASPTKAA
ncbi:Glycosyl transferase involved in cell wall bisynthesis [Planctomycetales bacterium 10988]|nr:Glycosyl transferase involved in cell wall bisynthesis [Planctomycetales bacterium 10988]